MRPTARLLASASAPLPLSISQASAQLIPPIPLYRRLLRVHRTLPDEMRFMGDTYVKSEFRLTRKTDNPLHIIGFLSQWKKYLEDIQQDDGFKGRRLDTDSMDKLSTEQVGQLYELMHATKEVWKSPAELEKQAVEAEDRSSGKSGN